MGHHFPILFHPSGASLDVVDLTDRNLQVVDHVTTDMRQCGFLTEQIAAARHTVLERNGLHGHTLILVDHLLKCRLNGMEHHLIFQSVTEHIHLCLQHRFQCRRCIDMQGSRTSQHTKGTDHTNQSEAVVTMQMRDEHSV